MAEAAAPPPRRTLLVALPLLVFGALAGLFMVMLFGGSGSRLPSTFIGRPAPDFTLPALEGLTRDGSPVPSFGRTELGQGRVTIVNVFASWCAPCHAEHPFLMDLAQSDLARDGRLRLVGINQKDQPENARRFLGAKGNPYAAVGVDAGGRASIEWGVYGVPETFIVKGDGTIAYKLVGPLGEGNLAAFRAEIDKAMR